MQSIIELSQLEFYAYHGVLEQERKVGNTYIVDVMLTMDISRPMVTDAIEDTVNYAEVYDLIKHEMSIPSNLLEHVAGRILRSLKGAFPRLKNVRISVAKVNPPIGGQAAFARVVVED